MKIAMTIWEPLFLHGLPTKKAFLWTCQQQMLDFAWDRGTLNASTNDSFEQIRKVENSECPDHSVCGAGRQVRCRSNKCAAILLMPKTPAQMLQAQSRRRRCATFARKPWGRASVVLCTGKAAHDGPHETGDAVRMCRQLARQRWE